MDCGSAGRGVHGVWSAGRGERGWMKNGATLGKNEEITLENLCRFRDGEPLLFIMNEKRYLLST